MSVKIYLVWFKIKGIVRSVAYKFKTNNISELESNSMHGI